MSLNKFTVDDDSTASGVRMKERQVYIIVSLIDFQSVDISFRAYFFILI